MLQNLYHSTHHTLLQCLGKLKIQIFCRYLANMGRTCKLHFKCTDFNSCAHITVYAECIYVLLSQSFPRRWISCWLLTKHCSNVCCDEFPVTQIDRKHKQVKNSDVENFICNQYARKTRYAKHRKCQRSMNNKVRKDKNAI